MSGVSDPPFCATTNDPQRADIDPRPGAGEVLSAATAGAAIGPCMRAADGTSPPVRDVYLSLVQVTDLPFWPSITGYPCKTLPSADSRM